MTKAADSNSRTSNVFSAMLATNPVLVADGGMGTSLFALGLGTGGSPELWNVDHPDRVASVHQGFVGAGADIILSNTFGGTAPRLAMHDLAKRLDELNRAAVGIAREVADGAARPIAVAGSVGPTGSLFAPLGDLTHADGVEIFAEQIRALVDGGSDVVWIETMSSFEELGAAVEAAMQFGLPVVTTMSFDTHGHTMMGVAPAELVRWWESIGSMQAALGANCGVGPADAVLAVAEMHRTDPDVAIVAKANCGIPEFIGGTLWYPASEENMSDYAALAIDAGARIIGACCGSLPDHVRQIREVVDSHDRRETPDRQRIEALLGPTSRPAVARPERTDKRRRARST